MKNKFICVHGHFYQPPRANPWTGAYEPEPSALPYRDWNWRILHECYGPNAAAGNYRHISFDFGPTLLDWIEANSRETYMAILEADRRSGSELGAGNAIAQVYNHIIMPLASGRDRRTQVRWGLEHFQHKFKRRSRGIWLAETAADDATLETLAAEGVEFAVLAPHQAAAFRLKGSGKWEPAHKLNFDTLRPYRWTSKEDPSRHVDIFFYHPVHTGALTAGPYSPETFLSALNAEFSPAPRRPELLSLACDGEYFGHHVKGGDAALAALAAGAKGDRSARFSNFAAFLDLGAPEYEVQIVSPSAWSCPHGVGRWSADCGCRISPAARSQAWRAGLRQAMDSLAAALDELYEKESSGLFSDPWAARDLYAFRLASPSAESSRRWLTLASARHLGPAEARKALALAEMQKDRLLMFTSCGWYFDDITGLEAGLILARAARAMERAEALGFRGREAFIGKLASCRSNFSGKTGADAFAAAEAAMKVTPEAAAASKAQALAGRGRARGEGCALRFKAVSDEKAGERRVFLLNAESSETLEQAEFSAAVEPDGSAWCRPACPPDGHAEALKAAAGLEGLALSKVFGEPFPPQKRPEALRDWEALFDGPAATAERFSRALPLLGSLRAAGFRPGAIPGFEEFVRDAAARFDTLLETASPALEGFLPWLDLAAWGAGAERAWVFRLPLARWLAEERPGAGLDKTFLAAVRKAAAALGLKHRYGH